MRREEKWKGKKEKGGREGERREKVKGWEKKKKRRDRRKDNSLCWK